MSERDLIGERRTWALQNPRKPGDQILRGHMRDEAYRDRFTIRTVLTIVVGDMPEAAIWELRAIVAEKTGLPADNLPQKAQRARNRVIDEVLEGFGHPKEIARSIQGVTLFITWSASREDAEALAELAR